MSNADARAASQLAGLLREAAELLAEVEWAGVHSWNYEEHGCPVCGADAAFPAGGAGAPFPAGGAAHEPGCRLAELLARLRDVGALG